ncbi:methyltransferase type 11 [Candidatus Beckwithbacteria bacterium CG23_combo_of_CG06-09_8_20_14_all_34_8]|uniref:Methyltransferase type 11 n=1 Tax=Candidatus Beckwithbacteria bacterium CG23_combo_of_CG06-09_8_20_14_all_34_8 TaxID=1974497 RepID=A0A2H0B5A8_9BACT|nr:MAG: methyltransferase type 11 [Candidatus Beckwithbacteria bacterium CG23_combo_of_CG06-09_8_20_14_all_34_8]
MKPNIHQLVSIISQNISLKSPIVEIGSFQVKGQQHWANLRPLFPGKKYLGCDMRRGEGVDKIENIEKLSFGDKSIDTLLSLETLEHVWDIQQAVKELQRVLKLGGFLAISTVFAHPIHDHPYDYWRFTPESLDKLFSFLSPRLIGWQGIADNPHTVFCIGFKQGQKEQNQVLEDIAIQYQKYLQNRPKDKLRLLLRKWRHEPLIQIKKIIAEKESFYYKISS